MAASEKTLSICMTSDDFLPAATGVGTHLQAVSEQLAARGHRVTVVTTRRAGQPARETWKGVDVYRTFTLRIFGFYQALPSVATLERIFDEVRPDLLHHHYLGVLLTRAMKVAARRRLPQVYTYHMTEDHLTQPLPMRPFRRLIGAQIVRRCNAMDRVISVSKTMAAQLPAKGITTPVQFISNPVRFETNPALEPAPRDAGFVVMFAGRLNPEKNLPLLLRGFAGLRASVPDASLWIAGEGSQRGQLERLCRELGIQQQVHFLGFLDHDALCRHYLACDVFVLPSLVETQGLVVMEAMWFGKPVVVADSVVSARELVDEGVNGFIVDHTQPQRLTRVLRTLRQEPALRNRMGVAAQVKSHTWRIGDVLIQIIDVYSWLLRERLGVA